MRKPRVFELSVDPNVSLIISPRIRNDARQSTLELEGIRDKIKINSIGPRFACLHLIEVC